ncbi:MAG TPA: endonuclease III [Bacteroidia bacterium]|nr:endonuclease III [Bacteroidia bacterium]
MTEKIDWNESIQPLIEKYRGKKYPLNYDNLYQLLVMLILAAQDSERNINKLAPKFFESFPNMAALAKATSDSLFPLINKVRNFGYKTTWLIKVAQQLKEDNNIPLTMEGLKSLPGISHKSANIILHEFGKAHEGVVVDMRIIRVANRLGIAPSANPAEIEKVLMKIISHKDWSAASLSMSFLGMDICRPTEPLHEECIMKNVCAYFEKVKKKE